MKIRPKGNIASIPLYIKILVGMIAGIATGMLFISFGQGEVVQLWIKPWGNIFIRMLQLIAVPLVLVSLIKGVTGIEDIRRFSQIGLKALLIYMSTTVCAILVGLALVLSVKPGNFVDAAVASQMKESYQHVVNEKMSAAESTSEQGPLSFLNDIVPDNLFAASSNNSKMLQVIFFAIFFGIAAISLPKEKTKAVLKVVDSLYDIILKMVDYIIRFAPYGVFALMAALVADNSSNLSIFAALGMYTLTVIAGLLLLIFVFYPLLVHLFTRIQTKHFIRSMYPVQLLAFTTSSSAATLPLNMETTERDLGISKEITSFVLPVGTTINMDGTSCYQAIAVVFIAQVMHIHLGWSELIAIVLLTTISSIGTPAIPGGSYVILTMVLSSVGIPADGLALILGVDRPLDMLRTSVNVTGDATVASIIDKPRIKRK
ncbi:dicarboxylate/amino acid:cation symporter [Bacteroides graminisolvens]|uniref:dicarboxylate/amino acid:cation symporter n=1 Tax=Bacteroides graminisolvens TaxID=477666 RepID=UPI0023F468EE|nr:dicarboxylate/amino acid:cation symporter [Bacteroides graminisolvens]MDD3209739.1 dicarboxylate/amino acid:cation symporter [Bacteroides graminisolvens]